MKRPPPPWSPAVVMLFGIGLMLHVERQMIMPLRLPLASAVPTRITGREGHDITISQQERAIAGMTTYLLRNYALPGRSAAGSTFSLYVGYYERQAQGRTAHSPRNCLPGAGWEPLNFRLSTVETADGPVRVNRYLLQNGSQRALVLYWYQGRGRVEANEYRVKWELLRDAALYRRSEEALVRIVVPIPGGESAADSLASTVARLTVPVVAQALPTWPPAQPAVMPAP